MALIHTNPFIEYKTVCRNYKDLCQVFVNNNYAACRTTVTKRSRITNCLHGVLYDGRIGVNIARVVDTNTYLVLRPSNPQQYLSVITFLRALPSDATKVFVYTIQDYNKRLNTHSDQIFRLADHLNTYFNSGKKSRFPDVNTLRFYALAQELDNFMAFCSLFNINTQDYKELNPIIEYINTYRLTILGEYKPKIPKF